mmetsp:Transcript_58896/g.164529  ORF Transcript_58896/g.164529 Transcript_58896/m.164529 type:complete len:456 (-) Transcript_58896:262-1629(-)
MNSNDKSGVDSWLARYPVTGGPRRDQLKAYDWFDSKSWKHSRPLHRAAMRGDVPTIKALCKGGRDPNEKMPEWFDSEPLGWAASLGQLGAVIALIQFGADPQRPKNKAGFTPLTDASREKHQHVVDFLLEYQRRFASGAAMQAWSEAPRQQAMDEPLQEQALYDKNRYQNGGPRGDQNVCAVAVCCLPCFIMCPLHCLSTFGCADAVDSLTSLPCKYLPCSPCDPNSKQPLWCCSEPIGWAASHGQLHTVMALVKNGAKPVTKNAAGFNAWGDAKRERHHHVVAWLDEWKAVMATKREMSNDIFDMKTIENGGPRPDQCVAVISLFCLPCFVICPLHCLSLWGCSDVVDCLTTLPCKYIPCSPCDPNSKNPLWWCAQPLGWASSLGQLHTVIVLVKNGADPDIKNLAGNNAWSDAARERHGHVMDWLAKWQAWKTTRPVEVFQLSAEEVNGNVVM